MKKVFQFYFFLFIAVSSYAQVVLPEREQARIVDEILQDRFNNLLPSLMERTGIDMWVIISREYNEDPVLRTMLPATWLSARRTTMIVFYNDAKKKSIEKLAIARYNVGESIKASWDMNKFPDQWDALMDIIVSRNPQKIGLNISDDYGHADGLDHTHYDMLMEKLPSAFRSKVISAEPLAVGWLETRTEKEMQIYPKLVSITHDIIAEGFSNKVITPGITTTDDLVWWFRQKLSSLGLITWFHPSVAIQRSDSTSFEHLRSFSNRPKDDVVQPAAGPTIGMWDMQQGVTGSGDYKLYPKTAYSIELNSSTFIPEWKKDIRIMLEEDGYFDGSGFRYIGGRQEKLHIIKY